jgi:hypothetical protein
MYPLMKLHRIPLNKNPAKQEHMVQKSQNTQEKRGNWKHRKVILPWRKGDKTE